MLDALVVGVKFINKRVKQGNDLFLLLNKRKLIELQAVLEILLTDFVDLTFDVFKLNYNIFIKFLFFLEIFEVLDILFDLKDLLSHILDLAVNLLNLLLEVTEVLLQARYLNLILLVVFVQLALAILFSDIKDGINVLSDPGDIYFAEA